MRIEKNEKVCYCDSINNNITDNINDIITRKIKGEESLWIKQT